MPGARSCADHCSRWRQQQLSHSLMTVLPIAAVVIQCPCLHVAMCFCIAFLAYILLQPVNTGENGLDCPAQLLLNRNPASDCVMPNEVEV